jgi:hypothetical protein
MSKKMIMCLTALSFAVPMLAAATQADAKAAPAIGKAKKPPPAIGKVKKPPPAIGKAKKPAPAIGKVKKPPPAIGKAKKPAPPWIGQVKGEAKGKKDTVVIRPKDPIKDASIPGGQKDTPPTPPAGPPKPPGDKPHTHHDHHQHHGHRWSRHWHMIERVPARVPGQQVQTVKQVSTDPVCVQGTWAEQEEKKVYVCLSWYFRGRLLTPDQLAQVLAQQQQAQ